MSLMPCAVCSLSTSVAVASRRQFFFEAAGEPHAQRNLTSLTFLPLSNSAQDTSRGDGVATERQEGTRGEERKEKG